MQSHKCVGLLAPFLMHMQWMNYEYLLFVSIKQWMNKMFRSVSTSMWGSTATLQTAWSIFVCQHFSYFENNNVVWWNYLEKWNNQNSIMLDLNEYFTKFCFYQPVTLIQSIRQSHRRMIRRIRRIQRIQRIHRLTIQGLATIAKITTPAICIFSQLDYRSTQIKIHLNMCNVISRVVPARIVQLDRYGTWPPKCVRIRQFQLHQPAQYMWQRFRHGHGQVRSANSSSSATTNWFKLIEKWNSNLFEIT